MRCVLAVLVLAGVASADTADATYKHGEDLFAQKQYIEAAHAFEASFTLDPDPAVLFDIAQAYRLGRACAQAARYYHRFLGAVHQPPDRERLERNMAEMDACARAETAAQPVIHEVVHETTVIQAPAVPLLPIALGGAGLIALGFGGYFTYDVRAAQRARGDACPIGCNWAAAQPRIEQLDTRGRHAEIAEGAFYAVGGAAVIASVVLLVLGHDQVTEHLVVAPGTVGARATF